MMTRHVSALLLTGLLVSLAAPHASAHVTYPTDDDAYQITVGQQGEPVYTFQRTGLDLIIRENTTERTEVSGLEETLTVTLVGPGGEERNLPIEPQFGSVGRYTFVEGYTLTQPGLYQVRIEGTIRNTAVSGTYDMPHEVLPQSEIMFPDEGLPTLKDLRDRNQALEQRVQALEEAGSGGDDAGRDSPAPLLGVLLALVLVAFVLRRKG